MATEKSLKSRPLGFDDEEAVKAHNGNMIGAAQIQTTQDPSSDYILVSNISNESAAAAAFRKKWGVHVLIWLIVATCVWGSLIIIIVMGSKIFPNLILTGDATLDAARVICIPFLMLWATASMWASYRKQNLRVALALSFLPLLITAWIIINMGV